MYTYNTNPPTDELARAQNELDQVKNIMVQNVEQILSRGERIELLVDKTDNMASQATAFRRGARTVRRQMWWKNKRVVALGVLVALVSRHLNCLLALVCDSRLGGIASGAQDKCSLTFLCWRTGARMGSCSPVLWRWIEPVRFQILNGTSSPYSRPMHPSVPSSSPLRLFSVGSNPTCEIILGDTRLLL